VVVNWYDVRQLNRPYSRLKMKKFFNNATIKTLLHVPQHIEFTTNDLVVFHFLKADIMRSTAHLFPRLLSNLKVMLYQGYISSPFPSLMQDNSISVTGLLRRQHGYPLYRGRAWRHLKRRQEKYGMEKMEL
jgi:hypothetical protein